MLRRLLAGILLLAAVALPAAAQSPYPPGPPPPVPGLPDIQRQSVYGPLSSSTCACSITFQLYGDSTDYQNWIEVWISIGGTLMNVAYNDAIYGWTVTSPTGSLATIPRPITDGVLTFNNPQTTPTVIIVGARRPRRTTEYSENTGVPARSLNQSFNDVYAIDREIWDKINDVTGRGFFWPPGFTAALLPTPPACANSFLAFDGGGLNPKCYPVASFGVVPSPVPGSPWIDVTQPAGTCTPMVADVNVRNTDNTARLQCYVSYAESLPGSLGRRIYIPPGSYCISSGPVVLTASGDWISGATQGSTNLWACGADATVFKMNGASQKLTDLAIQCKGAVNDPLEATFGATNPCINITSSATGAYLSGVSTSGGGTGIVTASGEANMFRVSAVFNYGTALMEVQGGLFGNTLSFDNTQFVTPNTGQTAGVAWTAAEAETVGTVRTLNGFYIVASACASDCKTGGSAPSLQNYGTNIVDHNVTWLLAAPVGSYAIDCDGACAEVYLSQVDMTGVEGTSLGINSNSLASLRCTQCIMAQNILSAVLINGSAAGAVMLTDSQIGGSNFVGTNAVSIGSSYTGPVQISGGFITGWTNAAGNSTIGVNQTGLGTLRVEGVSINDFSTGISIGPSLTQGNIITGNIIKSTTSGVVTNTGDDYYNITNNICAGVFVTQCVPGSGSAHSTITGNF